MKKIISAALCVLLIATAFAGCSSNKKSNIAENYSDTTLIIGYTEDAEPFIKADGKGGASGFVPTLWETIFDDVKGDCKNYRYEKIEKGYKLEDDGGFYDEKTQKEYSAGLLVGAVYKNDGTFNEDYSFSEPIISNRIIALTKKGGKVKTYADFKGAKVLTTTDQAKTAFEKNNAISSVCANVQENKDIKAALALLDSDNADVVITDEFSFRPLKQDDKYTELEGELDTIEYVIACAKYSGWKDSINEAIRELQSEEYGNGDEFTPIVEKYFGYDASSFDYVSKNTK